MLILYWSLVGLGMVLPTLSSAISGISARDIHDNTDGSRIHIIRLKRNSRGYLRGQTQSQYLHFGKPEHDGKAEAEANENGSHVIVSGTHGMGQAQSQFSAGECQDCQIGSTPSIASTHELRPQPSYSSRSSSNSFPIESSMSNIPVQDPNGYLSNSRDNYWNAPATQSHESKVPQSNYNSQEPGEKIFGQPHASLFPPAPQQIPTNRYVPSASNALVYIPDQGQSTYPGSPHTSPPSEYSNQIPGVPPIPNTSPVQIRGPSVDNYISRPQSEMPISPHYDHVPTNWKTKLDEQVYPHQRLNMQQRPYDQTTVSVQEPPSDQIGQRMSSTNLPQSYDLRNQHSPAAFVYKSENNNAKMPLINGYTSNNMKEQPPRYNLYSNLKTPTTYNSPESISSIGQYPTDAMNIFTAQNEQHFPGKTLGSSQQNGDVGAPIFLGHDARRLPTEMPPGYQQQSGSAGVPNTSLGVPNEIPNGGAQRGPTVSQLGLQQQTIPAGPPNILPHSAQNGNIFERGLETYPVLHPSSNNQLGFPSPMQTYISRHPDNPSLSNGIGTVFQGTYLPDTTQNTKISQGFTTTNQGDSPSTKSIYSPQTSMVEIQPELTQGRQIKNQPIEIHRMIPGFVSSPGSHLRQAYPQQIDERSSPQTPALYNTARTEQMPPYTRYSNTPQISHEGRVAPRFEHISAEVTRPNIVINTYPYGQENPVDTSKTLPNRIAQPTMNAYLDKAQYPNQQFVFSENVYPYNMVSTKNPNMLPGGNKLDKDQPSYVGVPTAQSGYSGVAMLPNSYTGSELSQPRHLETQPSPSGGYILPFVPSTPTSVKHNQPGYADVTMLPSMYTAAQTAQPKPAGTHSIQPGSYIVPLAESTPTSAADDRNSPSGLYQLSDSEYRPAYTTSQGYAIPNGLQPKRVDIHAGNPDFAHNQNPLSLSQFRPGNTIQKPGTLHSPQNIPVENINVAGGGSLYMPSSGNGQNDLPRALPSAPTELQFSQFGVAIPKSDMTNGLLGETGVPVGLVTPTASNKENDALSQAESSISNGQVSASAQGQKNGGTAKTQVSGTYSAGGTFSASAMTADIDRSASAQVMGSSEGAMSQSQGQGGAAQSQAQVQSNNKDGGTKATSQSGGIVHQSQSEVQADDKGGLADAQSSGPGQTSSQAQIGFRPENTVGSNNSSRGGQASAQSSSLSSQSQTEIHGTSKFGVAYHGAAQSASGTKEHVDIYREKNRKLFSTISEFGNTLSTNKGSEPTHPPNVGALNSPIPPTTSYMPPSSSQLVKMADPQLRNGKSDDSSERARSNSDTESEDETDNDDDDYDGEDYYDENSAKANPKHESVQHLEKSKELSVSALDTGESNKQKLNSKAEKMVVIKPAATDHYSIATNSKSRNMESSANAHNNSVLISDKPIQTKSLEPLYTDSKRNLNIPHSNSTAATQKPDNYVTITKSVAGSMDNTKTTSQDNKNFESTYYTKSSTCGYFTFSCNIVYGSNGRSKICRPKAPVNGKC